MAASMRRVRVTSAAAARLDIPTRRDVRRPPHATLTPTLTQLRAPLACPLLVMTFAPRPRSAALALAVLPLLAAAFALRAPAAHASKTEEVTFEAPRDL